MCRAHGDPARARFPRVRTADRGWTGRAAAARARPAAHPTVASLAGPWRCRTGNTGRSAAETQIQARASRVAVLSGHEWNDRGATRDRYRSLERVADLEKDLPALDAVTDVETDERGGRVVDAKARAVRRLEMPHIQVGDARRHLARVREHRGGEVGEQCAAHFRAERLHVVVVIPIVVVPA